MILVTNKLKPYSISFNGASYILGSLCFIVGSILAVLDPIKYQYGTGLSFVIGSVLFLFGAFCICVWHLGVVIEIAFNKEGRSYLKDYRAFYSTLQFFGGIFFTLGAIFFFQEKDRIAESLWIIGVTYFLGGDCTELITDTFELLECTDFQKVHKRKHLVHFWFGSFFDVLGTVMFSVGAAVFIVNNDLLDTVGNVVWIVGSVAYVIGPTYKIVGLILDEEGE